LCIFAAKDAFVAEQDASVFRSEHAFAAATRKTHFSQRKEQHGPDHAHSSTSPSARKSALQKKYRQSCYINMHFREREQKVEAPGRAEQSSSAQQVERFEQN